MRGGGLHPTRPDWWPPTKRPRATPGGLIAASVTACHAGRVGPRACARPLLCAEPQGFTGPPGVSRSQGMHACSWYWGSEVPGCRTLRLKSQSSAGLRMLPYPRSPDLVWPRHLHGTGCISARAMVTGFPNVWWRLCFGLGCGWVRVSAAPRHSWLGCWVCVRLCVRSACTLPLLAGVCGVGVCGWVRVPAAPRHSWLGCRGLCLLVCALRLHPATPGWGARRWCVCLGSGFGCAPPLLAGVLGCVCVCRRALLVPRHSWLKCVVGVCVFGLGFRLHPATPGCPVGVCVCWCERSACTPPLLAGVRAVGVCVWAWVSAAPRHSRLGCWGVCVLVWALRLHPATPGCAARRGCVCLGSGFGCARQLLAEVLGCVFARVRAPLVRRHSWSGLCGPGVCV